MTFQILTPTSQQLEIHKLIHACPVITKRECRKALATALVKVPKTTIARYTLTADEAHTLTQRIQLILSEYYGLIVKNHILDTPPPSDVRNSLQSLIAASDRINNKLRQKKHLHLVIRKEAAIQGIDPNNTETLLISVIDSLSELTALAEGANRRLEREVSRNKNRKKRHNGNPALSQLLANYVGLWLEVFLELPATSGHSIQFIQIVLMTFCGKIPKQILKEVPALHDAFSISSDAVRERIRDVTDPIHKLPILKSLIEELNADSTREEKEKRLNQIKKANLGLDIFLT